MCIRDRDGTPTNGKLNLATGIRYLKAGYYKVALSYTNNAYTPVSNNAVAFNVTMDKPPEGRTAPHGNRLLPGHWESPSGHLPVPDAPDALPAAVPAGPAPFLGAGRQMCIRDRDKATL